MKHVMTLLSSLFLILAITSCEYKELCYDHSHVVDVRIDYDWSLAPDADPQSVSAYLYRAEARSAFPERFDFQDKQGGNVRLEFGNYVLLGLNNDTETILLRRTENISSFEAYTRWSSLEEGTQIYTRTAMPNAAGAKEQPVALEPEMLWGGQGDALSLEFGQEGGHTTIYPRPLVSHVRVVLHNVPNLKYTGQFGGALSGLAGGVNVSTGKMTDDLVVVAFPVQKVDENTLVAEFNTFGHCPHEEEGLTNQHIFTLYAVLADGSKWYYSEDVSKQMHNDEQNPDQYNIYIELDDLPLPKPIVNGSGFKPDIDGWSPEEIEVTM